MLYIIYYTSYLISRILYLISYTLYLMPYLISHILCLISYYQTLFKGLISEPINCIRHRTRVDIRLRSELNFRKWPSQKSWIRRTTSQKPKPFDYSFWQCIKTPRLLTMFFCKFSHLLAIINVIFIFSNVFQCFLITGSLWQFSVTILCDNSLWQFSVTKTPRLLTIFFANSHTS